MRKITILIMSLFIVGSTFAQTLTYRHSNAGAGGSNVTATVDFLTECQQSVSLEIYSDIYTGIWTGAGDYDYYVNNTLVGSGTNLSATVDISSYIPVSSVKVVSKAYSWSVVYATVTVTENAALDAGPTVSDVTYCKDATASQLDATLNGDGQSLKWYTSDLGEGYSTTAPTPTTSTSGSTNYYVAQVNSGGCESERSIITVDVEDTPVVNCPDNATMTTSSTQEEINTGFIDFLNSFSNTGINTSSMFANETADFTGDYAPENWSTIFQSPSSTLSQSASNLVINAYSGGGGSTREITIPADGTISFDWSGTFTGSGSYVLAYKINGAQTQIAASTGTGSLSDIAVSQGDVFQFITWGATQYSTYTTTISNFVVNAGLPAISATDNGFVNEVDPANWSTVFQSPSSTLSHSASNLVINAYSGGGGSTREITIPADGVIGFDWSGTFTGSGSYVIAYKINGNQTQITASTGTGSLSDIAVSQGDVFQFITWGATQYSTYSTTISNFTYQYSTPYLGAVAGFAENGGSVDVTYVASNSCGQASCVKTFAVDLATDVEEQENSTLKYYPNPTSGMVTINLPEAGIVSVTNFNGNTLLSESLAAGTNILNLSQLSSGVYIIKHVSSNSVSTFNIIKE